MSASEASGSTPGPDLRAGPRGLRSAGTGRRRSSGCRSPASSAPRTPWPSGPPRSWPATPTPPCGPGSTATRSGWSAGDGLGAVRCAFWIGLVLSLRGEQAVAGRLGRPGPQRMLETEPEDIVERGYLLIHEFYAHLGRGDLARAEEIGAAGRAGRSPVRRPRPGRPRAGQHGPDGDLPGPGAGGSGPAGRGHGGDLGGRGLAGVRRPGLLRGDRGLPGARGLLPHVRLDAWR